MVLLNLTKERRWEIGYLLWRHEHRGSRVMALNPVEVARRAAREIGVPEAEIAAFIISEGTEMIRSAVSTAGRDNPG